MSAVPIINEAGSPISVGYSGTELVSSPIIAVLRSDGKQDVRRRSESELRLSVEVQFQRRQNAESGKRARSAPLKRRWISGGFVGAIVVCLAGNSRQRWISGTHNRVFVLIILQSAMGIHCRLVQAKLNRRGIGTSKGYFFVHFVSFPALRVWFIVAGNYRVFS